MRRAFAVLGLLWGCQEGLEDPVTAPGASSRTLFPNVCSNPRRIG